MLLGILFPYPAAAFAAGVASHAVLDAIPHEPAEDLILTYPKDRQHDNTAVRRRIIISSIDIGCALEIIAVSWIFSRQCFDQTGLFTGMIAGIAGGLLPDCIVVLTFFLDNRFLRWYFELHNRIHFVIVKVHVPRIISIMYQMLLTCILVFAAYQIM